MNYGIDEKIGLLIREVRRMKRTAPGRVMAHRITQARADREIGIMTEILENYIEARKEYDLFHRSNDDGTDTESPARTPGTGEDGE